jgi:hypothetical protein
MTNKNSIWASAIIGVVLLLCVFILKGTIAGFSTNNRLTVTGSSERFVKSDTAKWIITVSKRVNKSEDGPAALEKDLAQVTKILEKNGFTKDQITMGQGGTSQVCALSPQGYESCSVGVVATNFTQSIIVETPDVDKVYAVQNSFSQDLSTLSVSSSVEYYYNNLKNIRVEMLAEATKNAKERAEGIALAGGAKVGTITSLSSGVFQVTSKNSVDVDNAGAYDTSTIDKKITATVKADFSLK